MRKLLSFFFASVFILAISLLPSSLMAVEPFDINLLTNPSCDNNDYAGWTRTDGGSGWKAENNVWSSSYVECKMTQTVNLLTAGFTEEQLDALPFVLAAGSFVCPCQFAAKTTGFAKINITFLDASNAQISNAILADRSYITTIPWDTYTNQLQIPSGTRSIKFYFAGKDAYLWGGQYGPQFDNMWLSLSTTPAAEHAVTTASVEHGSFVVDKATASAGETVKITVNPATNYGLKAFNVKTSTGSTIAVAADSTFIMPAGFDVTVSGEFWKTGGLEVSCAVVDNGSFSVDKTIANAGETVKITVNPATNYGLKAFNVKKSDNTSITVAADGTFIMPVEFDVTVSGEFWKTEGLVVTCAVVDNGSFSVDKLIANAGETVKITVNPATNYGLKAFNVKKSDNTSITVAADGTFIMPAGFDVTVSGEFWKTEGLVVSCTVVDNGSFSVDKPIANAGETVKITVNPATNYGLKAFNVKKSDNTSIAVAADSTFIMPAGFDVTVSGEFWEFNEVTIENAFFEGFESGNLNRWAQEREPGSNLWEVNTLTSNNRTPYAGSYNATLRWGNTCWLFTPLYLHADTEYKFEMYARQDEWTTSYANITVMLGSQENSTAMTHSIVAKSGITNGDYTQLSGSITLTESKEYFLGIKGYISSNPYYLSIDNIKLWIEDPTTSLKSADDDKGLNVYAIARTIVIENSNPDQKVQVYNISGHCIANTVNTVIAVPTNGLYLVRIGDETHKVLVK